MGYRLAVYPFLSTVPLVSGLTRHSDVEVQLVEALPHCLAELLHDDAADVALLPVVEFFRGQGAGMVPGIGVASRGAGACAKLFTRVEPQDIERVSVDRAARSTVALLRILLAEQYGTRPDFLVSEPLPEKLLATAEAALVVGDRCCEVERHLQELGKAEVTVLDLGQAWTELTDLPFVFATWVLGNSFAARATNTQRADLARLLIRTRDRNLADLPALAERTAAADRPGPGGESGPAALFRFWRSTLHYVLGQQELAGLGRFYELCVQHTICPAGRSPRLAAMGEGG